MTRLSEAGSGTGAIKSRQLTVTLPPGKGQVAVPPPPAGKTSPPAGLALATSGTIEMFVSMTSSAFNKLGSTPGIPTDIPGSKLAPARIIPVPSRGSKGLRTAGLEISKTANMVVRSGARMINLGLGISVGLRATAQLKNKVQMVTSTVKSLTGRTPTEGGKVVVPAVNVNDGSKVPVGGVMPAYSPRISVTTSGGIGPPQAIGTVNVFERRSTPATR
jgi:hypothetical protein